MHVVQALLTDAGAIVQDAQWDGEHADIWDHSCSLCGCLCSVLLTV